MTVTNVLRALLSPVRFTQFLSVGIVGLLVDNVSLVVLVQSTDLAPHVAAFPSKELSITVMFLLNERWTFAETENGDSRLGVRFLKSNLVRSVGAAVGIGVLYLLTQFLGIWYVAANVAGVGVGFLFNYVLESLFTWGIGDRS